MTTASRLALSLLACAAVTLLPAGLTAQQQQGDIDLQLSGSVLTTVGQEGASVSSALVQARGSYFVTDRLALGAFPSLVHARSETEVAGVWREVSETKVGLGFFANYSFLSDDAVTVPYLGAQFYRIDVTDENESGWIGANGGLRFYINRSTAFDVGGNYLIGLGDRGGALVLMQFGLGFLL